MPKKSDTDLSMACGIKSVIISVITDVVIVIAVVLKYAVVGCNKVHLYKYKHKVLVNQ